MTTGLDLAPQHVDHTHLMTMTDVVHLVDIVLAVMATVIEAHHVGAATTTMTVAATAAARPDLAARSMTTHLHAVVDSMTLIVAITLLQIPMPMAMADPLMTVLLPVAITHRGMLAMLMNIGVLATGNVLLLSVNLRTYLLVTGANKCEDVNNEMRGMMLA